MMPGSVFLSRRTSRHVAVVLLVVLCLAASAASLTAAPVGQHTVIHANPVGMVVVGFFDDLMGNRTRMIQVACIFGAIGIFILTRTYR